MNASPRITKNKKRKEKSEKVGSFQRLTPDALFSFFTASVIRDRVTFTR